MQKEIVGYYKGRTVLAKLMGQKPESFTEKDVQVSINGIVEIGIGIVRTGMRM